MKININHTSDIHTSGIKCVVYGESGVGKTVLCSTAPAPFIISAEQGLLSLAGKNIPYVEATNIKQIGDIYSWLVNSEESDIYETICIDSLSELTSVCLLEIKNKMISESDTGKIDARQSYGKLAESIGTMIRKFRDIQNKNVVFVAKQKRIEDDESGTSTFQPFLPGKVLPFDLPYLVDEVFCMRVSRKGARYIQTSAERKYPAKDRSGKLDAEEQPDLTSIFNKIKGI